NQRQNTATTFSLTDLPVGLLSLGHARHHERHLGFGNHFAYSLTWCVQHQSGQKLHGRSHDDELTLHRYQYRAEWSDLAIRNVQKSVRVRSGQRVKYAANS